MKIYINWLLILLLFVSFLHCIYFFNFTIDDAFISYRYAENLISGKGLVFNDGERVEGYSNFLWTLILTIFPLLHINIIVGSKILGIFFHIATICVVFRLVLLLTPSKNWPVLIAPAFYTVSHCAAAWAVAGLETSLFTFMLVAAIFTLVHGIRIGNNTKFFVFSGIFFLLAALTRPEGILFFAAAAFWLIIFEWDMFLSKKVWWFCIIPVVGYILFTGWRFCYYGEFFPNTYYVKTGGSVFDRIIRGFLYLKRILNIHYLALICSLIPVMSRKNWLSKSPVSSLFFMIGAGLFYILYVGGDGIFGPPRFLVPMLPFVFVLAGIGFIQIANAIGQKLSKQKKSPVRVLPGLFVLFLLSLTGVESFIEKEIDPRKYTFVAKCTEAGKWLNRNTTTNTMVASSPIGAVAYYSKRPIIDMLGLADKHIARRILPGVGKGRPGHEKGDGAYVLSRKPDIILMGAVWIDQYPRLIDRVNLGKFLLYTSEKEIWAHPDFKKYYEPVNVLLDSGKYFGFYRLNS